MSLSSTPQHQTGITAEMSVPDIVSQYPQTEAIFKQFGLTPSYKALQYETLHASALVNQIPLDDLLSALNKTL